MREEIKNIILGLLKDEDVYIESLSGGDNPDEMIKVVLDTEEGIPSGTLVRISKKIRNNDDFIEIGGDDYEIELSSPGITAELTLPRHFKKNIGRNLRIVHNAEELDSPIITELLGCDDEKVILKGIKKGEAELHLNYDEIIKAKIKLKW